MVLIGDVQCHYRTRSSRHAHRKSFVPRLTIWWKSPASSFPFRGRKTGNLDAREPRDGPDVKYMYLSKQRQRNPGLALHSTPKVCFFSGNITLSYGMQPRVRTYRQGNKANGGAGPFPSSNVRPSMLVPGHYQLMTETQGIRQVYLQQRTDQNHKKHTYHNHHHIIMTPAIIFGQFRFDLDSSNTYSFSQDPDPILSQSNQSDNPIHPIPKTTSSLQDLSPQSPAERRNSRHLEQPFSEKNSSRFLFCAPPPPPVPYP